MTDTNKPSSLEQLETLPIGARVETGAPYRLVVVGIEGASVHPLPSSGRVVLGRARECDVQIRDPSISRSHATLDLGPPMRLTDTASANGVIVRDARLAPNAPVEITAGEAFTLGSVTVLIQRIDRSAPRAPAPIVPTSELPAGFVVTDPSMRALLATADRAARSALRVLIVGETGVGKEMIASRIHRASPRADGPFVGLNCAALSPELLESELFGHEKGAFTGASESRPGLLETAHGGTVFLDEVGEMPTAMQAKLLRVLEQHEVLRVGGRTPRTIDVRVVSATHRDLAAACNQGTFRSDLYFRLNGITLHVPPLRERVGEIDALVRLFASRVATTLGERAPAVSPDAMACLRTYRWPGNVRELRNVVERAVVLGAGAPITPSHLPPEVTGANVVRACEGSGTAPAEGHGALRSDMESLERKRILDALEQCGGNQTRAAEVLGIPRRTLVRRLAQYQLPRPRQR